MIKGVAILWVLLMPGAIMAQHSETGFLDRSVACEGTDRPYQVYVPREYSDARKWPVILFLHGSGERGEDGLKQTQVGLGSAVRAHPERWPAIAVFPQLRPGESWSGSPEGLGMAALAKTMTEFSADSSRIYLTGLSLGGRGAWQLAFAHPEQFAALVPICGFIEGEGRYAEFLPESADGPYPVLARQLAALPTWVFHGADDSLVPVAGARRIVKALQDVGAPVKYSELPGVGHNSWDAAYASPELSSWLFEQRRASPAQESRR